MKTTLSTHEIAEALYLDENADWTRPGSLALAEWIEEWEEDTGEEMELDIVAIRCEFSEFSSLQDWIKDYYSLPLADALKSAGVDLEGGETDEETDTLIRDHIQPNGYLIEFAEGIIVSDF